MTKGQVLKFKSTISKDEIETWLAEGRANRARLVACRLHHFSPAGVKIGEKLPCDHCGGTMGLPEIGAYIDGYEAGGGSADDVWPGYRAAKVSS